MGIDFVHHVEGDDLAAHVKGLYLVVLHRVVARSCFLGIGRGVDSDQRLKVLDGQGVLSCRQCDGGTGAARVNAAIGIGIGTRLADGKCSGSVPWCGR